jgi:hypothetical protein
MTGTAPSLIEKAAGMSRSLLEALSKAFSAKVTLEDIKYLRYRVYEESVELQDRAKRFGGILTSVGQREADLTQLVSFLKKNGAKEFQS